MFDFKSNDVKVRIGYFSLFLEDVSLPYRLSRLTISMDSAFIVILGAMCRLTSKEACVVSCSRAAAGASFI